MNSRITLILIAFIFVGCSGLKKTFESKLQAKKFMVSKRWVTSTLEKDHFGYRHPHRMTPIFAGAIVVQGNGLDGIAAYDRKTGQERWRLPVRGGVEGGAALQGEALFFGGGDGLFYSADVYSGEVNWTFPVKSQVFSRPVVVKNQVYFIGGNNKVYALSTAKGKQLWMYSRREVSNLSIRGGSEPSVVGNSIYLGFSDGFLVSLNLKSGKVNWEKSLNRNRRFRDIDAGPVIEGDRLYISSFDDSLYCIDRKTGQTIWQFEQGGFSKVTLTADKLFFSTTEGQVVALEKKSGKEKWRYKLKSGLATQPQVYRGLVVFGEYEGDFKILDAQTGKAVGGFSPGRGIMASPLIDQATGEVFFISVNANLFALKMAWRPGVEKWSWEN